MPLCSALPPFYFLATIGLYIMSWKVASQGTVAGRQLIASSFLDVLTKIFPGFSNIFFLGELQILANDFEKIFEAYFPLEARVHPIPDPFIEVERPAAGSHEGERDSVRDSVEWLKKSIKLKRAIQFIWSLCGVFVIAIMAARGMHNSCSTSGFDFESSEQSCRFGFHKRQMEIFLDCTSTCGLHMMHRHRQSAHAQHDHISRNALMPIRTYCTA